MIDTRSSNTDELAAEIVKALQRNGSLKLEVDTGVSLAGFYMGLAIVIAAAIVSH